MDVIVNGETGFLGKPFKLSDLFFEEVEFVSVPGGSVGEGDGPSLNRCKLVEAGGE